MNQDRKLAKSREDADADVAEDAPTTIVNSEDLGDEEELANAAHLSSESGGDLTIPE